MNFYHVTFKFKYEPKPTFKAPMVCKDDDTLIFKLREAYAKCVPKQFKHLTYDRDVESILLEKQ